MRVTVKNNPREKISKDEVKEATKYFFSRLLGDRAKGLGTVSIYFRKMALNRGGKAIVSNLDTKNYKIVLNSVKSKSDIFRVLAHECTHVRQYFTKELTYEHGFKVIKGKGGYPMGRFKTVTIWKGKRIGRSIYKKRAWEVEARKYESLSLNLTSKLKRFNPVGTVVTELPKPVSNIASKVLDLVAMRAVLNGDLIDLVVGVNKDKQYRLEVLREVFKLKESGKLEQYYIDSVAWVRSK